MGTSLLPLVLSQYFEKHVDKANGIYSGGSCIGAFVLPIIADKLIAEYGTSGMFLVFSAIILNSVPAALLLRKPKDSTAKCNKNPGGVQKETTYENNLKILKSPKEGCVYEEKSDINLKQNIESSLQEKEMPSEVFELPNDSVSYIDIHQRNYKIEKGRNTNLPTALHDVTQSELNIEKSYNSLCKSSSSTPNKESTSNSFQVFLDVTYTLILLTQAFMLIVITTIWTIIVDASMDKGVTKQEGVYILICMGIADTIGRFCLGYITDGGRMSKINFQILCAAGLGVFHILFIFLEGFIMVMISVGFAGLFIAGHVMIGVGIINQCIEKEHVTMAVASRYFAFALMSFTQAPMIGFFRENWKSYDGLFILLTVLCGICIVLVWFTPIAAKRRDRKKQLR
ncbi:uncharacterized protein TNIN_384291 [Trichonephila inaurata madagascariensis]|uniref:Monocarboxylate transporter n=1 Tax=Trichonephila inaurata madagascariensis TaxID=2747483 RepID=A0A8X6WMW6_9ARAC|nr:uncharacterized protein TNIN_384291 [Trichonephila inaurata madagascariensis]